MTGNLQKNGTITMKRWQWGVILAVFGAMVSLVVPHLVSFAFDQGASAKSIEALSAQIEQMGDRQRAVLDEIKASLTEMRSLVGDMGRALARAESDIDNANQRHRADMKAMSEVHRTLIDDIALLEVKVEKLNKEMGR